MKYFNLIIFVNVLLLISCNKINNNECLNKLNSSINIVQSSTLTASVNQEINFELQVGNINSCGISTEIETTQNGNIITINAITQYRGCACAEIYLQVIQSYIFKSATAGNFKLKFNKGNNTFIEKDVVVQ
jgi:metal-sulfur cluster biosynthetic enzyme